MLTITNFPLFWRVPHFTFFSIAAAFNKVCSMISFYVADVFAFIQIIILSSISESNICNQYSTFQIRSFRSLLCNLPLYHRLQLLTSSKLTYNSLVVFFHLSCLFFFFILLLYIYFFLYL